MGPRLRRPALALHLVVSVGWIGAAFAYVAVAAAAASTASPESARAGWATMELIGWWVLVPLALGTVVTGVWMATATRWGLWRHYWVTVSLVLTLFATGVLLVHMPDVSALADRARTASAGQVSGMGSDLFHSVAGVVVLVFIAFLNVYKPKGLTRYGWRKQQAEQGRSATSTR